MRIIERFTKISSTDALCQPFNTKIFITPDNKVLLLRTDYKTSEQYSTIFDQNGTYLCSWWSYFTFSKRCLSVNSKIIHLVRKILEERDHSQLADKRKKQFENRISNLETDIQKLMRMVEKHDGNVSNKLKKIGDVTMYPRKVYF